MTTHKAFALLVLTLALLGPTAASAQTTELPAVQFSWGAIHRGPGQALAINFVVPDAPEFGTPTGFAASLFLTDADGRPVYETKLEGTSGRALSFVIVSDERDARKTIPGDAYALVDPNVRVIQIGVKVVGLSDRVALTQDRIVATLEVIEVSSGRVIGFAINPRVIVPDAPE